ncbi:MAG: hypothetical protein JWQ47_1491 [Glaciihabitans sp.]|jgi:hypothetical protein|nr:hypothetical protein [Glaciihabitans sp.]
MTSRLSPILSRSEFSGAELDALRLDGEVYRLDDCTVPVDEIPGPLLRAAVLASELPPRLIVEQHSAAWVWGALGDPPPEHEVCADTAARTRPAVGAHLRVREVVIERDDLAVLSGVSITTPLRTAIDLARFVIEWSYSESAIIRELMRIGDFRTADCAQIMNRRRNLPNKRMALARLAAAQSETVVAATDRVQPA